MKINVKTVESCGDLSRCLNYKVVETFLSCGDFFNLKELSDCRDL